MGAGGLANQFPEAFSLRGSKVGAGCRGLTELAKF
jgi:hypothetical protein